MWGNGKAGCKRGSHLSIVTWMSADLNRKDAKSAKKKAKQNNLREWPQARLPHRRRASGKGRNAWRCVFAVKFGADFLLSHT